MGHRALVLALALPALSACVTAFGPPDRLIYSHAIHTAKDKVQATCLDCHVGIDESAQLDRTYIPAHEGCFGCHKTKEEQDDCARCHTEPSLAERSATRDSGLVFSHQSHLERVAGNCMRCHADIPAADSSEATRTPPMSACTDSCHADTLRDMRCEQCHETLAGYNLESIESYAHFGGFEHGHGRVARRAADTCAQCHARTFCSDCHSNTQPIGPEDLHAERASRSFVHPSPYVAIHAMDAETRRDRCETCHTPSMCSSCHAAFGVGALEGLGLGPHPAGWLDPGSARFHGTEARQKISTCAGCHDRGLATNCIRCHQVGGPGGNPHPPGFARRGEPTDNRMCRTCHWSAP